jgi:ACS family tartrate transporter-like MFS transporter
MNGAHSKMVEGRTIAKISWRILPLAAVTYCVAYIDRTNVSFATLTMNKDLGISAYVYGWGAGIFFLSYFLLEIPSNLTLERVGARVWIARIMLTWGRCCGADGVRDRPHQLPPTRTRPAILPISSS